VVSELVPANGHRPDEVRFGDAPGNVLSTAMAAELLRLMRAKAPEDFAYWVGYALAGVPPKAKRG
jgi:hypothetical protein